mgnify:CR=1 FL=1
MSKFNPQAAFDEADKMSMAESDNAMKAEWRKCALKIQPMLPQNKPTT